MCFYPANLGFCLSVLELGRGTPQTDRWTDTVAHFIMSPSLRGGGIKTNMERNYTKNIMIVVNIKIVFWTEMFRELLSYRPYVYK